MRRVSAITLAFVLAFGGLGACSSGDSAADRAQTKAADAAAIANLEAIIHGAQSTKDIEAMMKPFAENAVFTLGGQTLTGKEEIRKFVLTTAPFKPENNWISVTPAYKIRTSTDGSRGTLYFECHYVDVNSKLVKAAVSVDVKASKVDGQWILTNIVAAPAVLS
jgi:uncharacterized protein (TIGR02246 family)